MALSLSKFPRPVYRHIIYIDFQKYILILPYAAHLFNFIGTNQHFWYNHHATKRMAILLTAILSLPETNLLDSRFDKLDKIGLSTDKGAKNMAFEIKNGKLIIPEGTETLPENFLKGNKELQYVEIPGSVKEIPVRAFMNCENLKTVILHDGIQSIGWVAFDGCGSLEEILIPDSVRKIGEGVFSCCTSLSKVKLPQGLTSISRGLFSGCHSLAHLDLPKTVTSIEYDAFSATGFTELTIPKHIKAIGSKAFCYSDLEKLVIDHDISHIPYFLVRGCGSLTYLYIDDQVTFCDEDVAKKTDIPFLHISTGILKGFDDNNKINALDTFLKTENEYSKKAKSAWHNYIKRYKVKYLKMCLKEDRPDVFIALLAIVTLSRNEKQSLEESCRAYSGYEDCLHALNKANLEEKKLSGSLIESLASAIPVKSSPLKKNLLLEAATLYGTEKELEDVIAKYAPFEFPAEAIIYAVRIGELKKLKILLSLDSTVCGGWTWGLTSKYGYSDSEFSPHLTAPSARKLFLDKVEKLVTETLDVEKPKAPDTNVDPFKKAKLLRLISSTEGYPSAAELLRSSFDEQNFDLFIALSDAGFKLDKPKTKDAGYSLSRLLPNSDKELCFIVLKQFADAAGEDKIKLDDKSLYDKGSCFNDSDIFKFVVTRYDTSRFTKKNLLNFVIENDNAANLSCLIDNSAVHLTKPLHLALIEQAKNSKAKKCLAVLETLFAESYGDKKTEAEKLKKKSETPAALLRRDWSYSVENGEVTIKGYKGTDTVVKVPDIIAGKPVCYIAYGAFSPRASRILKEISDRRSRITEITLPKNLKDFSIENSFSYFNGLLTLAKKVNIPEGSVPYSEKLISLILDIPNVEELTGIENCGDFVINTDLVLSKDRKKLIYVKTTRLESLTIPDSVTLILPGALNHCKRLKELSFSSIKINKKAFGHSIYHFGKIPSLEILHVSGLEELDSYMFIECNNVTEVYLGEGVKKIGFGSLQYMQKLKKLVIPESCTEIDDRFLCVYKHVSYSHIEAIGLPKDLTIFCKKGSYAEKFAKEKNVAYCYY